MDLCRVRYFLAVCETGSFTAAAKACGVSQPAVTTGVARLERALGDTLFERRHPVRLTQFGAQMRPLLEALQLAAERVTAAIEQRREETAKQETTGLPMMELVEPPLTRLAFDAQIHDDNAVQDRSRLDSEPSTGGKTPAPVLPIFEELGRSADLLVRSSIAIERADRAIRRYAQARAQAQDCASAFRHAALEADTPSNLPEAQPSQGSR